MRATLILVPLFGLQYLIFPVRPEEGTALYDFYHYFIALLISLQVSVCLSVQVSVFLQLSVSLTCYTLVWLSLHLWIG